MVKMYGTIKTTFESTDKSCSLRRSPPESIETLARQQMETSKCQSKEKYGKTGVTNQ